MGVGTEIRRSVRVEGPNISLGSGCYVDTGAVLSSFGGRIEVDKNVFIGPYSLLYGHGGLAIGADTLIAGHVMVIPANPIFDDLDTPIRMHGETRVGIAIGRDVWIGAGAKILDGVTVGDGAVVAAGTVVRTNVAERTVVAGVPARVIRERVSERRDQRRDT